MFSEPRLCRVLALSIMLMVGVSRPALAAPRDLSAYTLRIHVFTTSWTGSEYGGYHGYGRANLIEGPATHAVEYTYSCGVKFVSSDPGEAYPAKWKKPGQSLEMLMGVIGSPDKTKSCELKVTLKEFVYDPERGASRTLTQEEYRTEEANRAARLAAMSPEDKNPANYPLHLAVLRVHFTERVGGMYIGLGQGNLKTAKGLSSVDFTVSCPLTFPTTAEGRFYSGQWKHDGTEMVLLLHKNIDPSSVAICDLKTTIHADVYVLESADVVKAVSQEEYRLLKQSEAKSPATE
jgi:hypothetical protein